MLNQREEIVCRVANSMISDYGGSAAEEAERRIADNENDGRAVSAMLWRDVKIAIDKINSKTE